MFPGGPSEYRPGREQTVRAEASSRPEIPLPDGPCSGVDHGDGLVVAPDRQAASPSPDGHVSYFWLLWSSAAFTPRGEPGHVVITTRSSASTRCTAPRRAPSRARAARGR